MRETKGLGVYNVAIIGAGTAGLVAAAGTVGLGGRVALVERNKMGGDCLNYSCVPSKALIASARVIDNIRHASKWGLHDQEPQFEFETVFESMRSRRAKIAPHDSAERFESLGVDVLHRISGSNALRHCAGWIRWSRSPGARKKPRSPRYDRRRKQCPMLPNGCGLRSCSFCPIKAKRLWESKILASGNITPVERFCGILKLTVAGADKTRSAIPYWVKERLKTA